ncbi:hypothetical protein CS542_00380 [Pedobacter sp. IW39]|nr:hypothetical protein CS542_00380 [Pedobacter sp. IW39]
MQSYTSKFYCTYLRTGRRVYCIFEFACYLFTEGAAIENNYGNPYVLALSKILKSRAGEHRMEAFIRFQQCRRYLLLWNRSSFNVLPLIATISKPVCGSAMDH